MENMMAQINAVTQELEVVKNELIAMKGAHATLHQSTVESSAQVATKYSEYATRLVSLESKLDGLDQEAGAFAGKGFPSPSCCQVQVTNRDKKAPPLSHIM